MSPLDLAHLSWLGLELLINLFVACPTVPAIEPVNEVITLPAEEVQP